MNMAMKLLQNLGVKAVYMDKEGADGIQLPNEAPNAGADDSWEEQDFLEDEAFDRFKDGDEDNSDDQTLDTTEHSFSDDNDGLTELERDAKKEAEAEKDEDEKDEDEDEDEKEEDEDEDEKEEDEKDEDEDEKEEDEKDEDEDEKDEDEKKEDEEKDTPSSKEFQRLRKRAQAAESKHKDLSDLVKNAATKQQADKKPLIEKRNAKLRELAKAQDDGDVEKAGDLQIELADIKDEIRGLSSESDRLINQQSNAESQVQTLLADTIAEVQTHFPALDPNSKSINPTLVTMVNNAMSAKMKTGAGAVKALVDAVEEVTTLVNMEPAGAKKQPAKSAKAKTAKDKKKAVERRKKAAGNTAPRTSNSRNKGAAKKRISEMSEKEFNSKENQQDMKKTLGIKFDW